MATTFDLPLALFVNEEATMHQNYSRGNRKRLPSELLACQSVAQYHVFLVMVFQHTPCSRGMVYSANDRLEFEVDPVN